MNRLFFAILLLLFYPLNLFALEESQCYGTPAKGRLEFAWQLPSSGKNFSAYSAIGVFFGRNYVHSQVYKTVVEAYSILEKQNPTKVFVYGESGWRNGGRLRPHKTHQNGLSVDFFVPVINSSGESVPLPRGILNKFGYGIEFTGTGQYQDLKIDYQSMTQHLSALQQAAFHNQIKIERVIFDNTLQRELFKIPEAALLAQKIKFSTKKPWVRHDEHYHIDFNVPCETQ